jgi:HEAT repeat protein
VAYCDGGIGVGTTSEALTAEQWHALSHRVVAGLSDPEPATRLAALGLVTELHNVERSGPAPVPELITMELRSALAERAADTDPKIRGFVVQLLAELCMADASGRPAPGPNPVPILLKTIADPEQSVRRLSVNALSSIGLEHTYARTEGYGSFAPQVVAALLKASDEPDRLTRLAAVHSIGYAGSAAAPAVPRLVEWLDSADHLYRKGAAWALRELGPIGAPAVPKLSAMLTGPDRLNALLALGRMGEASRRAVPAIAPLLEDPDMAGFAVMELTRLGPVAEAALPALAQRCLRVEGAERDEVLAAIKAIASAPR